MLFPADLLASTDECSLSLLCVCASVLLCLRLYRRRRCRHGNLLSLRLRTLHHLHVAVLVHVRQEILRSKTAEIKRQKMDSKPHQQWLDTHIQPFVSQVNLGLPVSLVFIRLHLFLVQACWLTDSVKVLRPIRQKVDHFGDIRGWCKLVSRMDASPHPVTNYTVLDQHRECLANSTSKPNKWQNLLR